MEPLVLRGHFRIFDYFASHSQLLIRCSEVGEENTANTDLRFHGVKYVDLPIYFENPIVRAGTQADFEAVANRLQQAIIREFQEVFVVEANQQRYYVLAGGLELSENELPPLQSRIKRW